MLNLVELDINFLTLSKIVRNDLCQKCLENLFLNILHKGEEQQDTHFDHGFGKTLNPGVILGKVENLPNLRFLKILQKMSLPFSYYCKIQNISQ